MLETEIKKLTDAVTRLADLMEQSDKLTQQEKSYKEDDTAREAMQRKRDEAKATKPVAENTTKKKKSVTELVDEHCEKVKEEVASKSETQIYTVDDIKSLALAISRKDRSKQKDIKAKLAEHDARVAADLKGDGLQVVGEWLTALKDEVGA